MRGATRLVYGGRPSLVGAEHADNISLTGLILDGMGRALPPREELLHIEACRGVRIMVPIVGSPASSRNRCWRVTVAVADAAGWRVHTSRPCPRNATRSGTARD
jgi:hypothetical protein